MSTGWATVETPTIACHARSRVQGFRCLGWPRITARPPDCAVDISGAESGAGIASRRREEMIGGSRLGGALCKSLWSEGSQKPSFLLGSCSC